MTLTQFGIKFFVGYIMKDMIEGFFRFHRDVYPTHRDLFRRLAKEQNPGTLFICCSDSRMIPELITQCEPGDLFVIRNAGNIIPSFGPDPGGVTATVEYAISVLGVRDLIVCGHSDCGAMKAIATNISLEGMPAVRNWLQYADAAKLVSSAKRHCSVDAHVDSMVRENVIAQINNVRTHPSVALGLTQSRLNLHGWIYDIESGSLEVLDHESSTFSPVLDS